MYVFDHYVCFYSAVFGFAKKRRIPMRVRVVKALQGNGPVGTCRPWQLRQSVPVFRTHRPSRRSRKRLILGFQIL